MKKLATALAVALLSTVAAVAKDIKTFSVSTTPEMHCANCENKIKSNLRFEGGVKDIVTDIPSQTVTITYDADKTSEAALTKAFGKIGYQVTKKQTPAACKKSKNGKACDKACAEQCGKKCEAGKHDGKAKTADGKAKTAAKTSKKVKKTRTDGTTGASQQMH